MSEDKTSSDSLGITEIMELIPHRYPMLLVDKVKDIVLMESATGIKCVTMNEEFFQGHFPNQPVMPGVLQVEAMAQTAGVLASKSLGGADSTKSVFFMTIDNVKFRRIVQPGDVLEMKVVVEKARGKIWQFSAVTYVEGKPVSQATFKAMIGD